MKALRQFVLIFAVCLPIVTPAMACALPGARMTQAEMACCKHMTPPCGNTAMTVAHGLCHKDLPVLDHFKGILTNGAVVVFANAAGFEAAPTVQIIAVYPSSAPQHEASPPESPPTAISILRI